MVFKPENLVDITRFQQNAIEYFIKEIGKKLSGESKNKKVFNIYVDAHHGQTIISYTKINQAVILSEIKKQYEDAGWKNVIVYFLEDGRICINLENPNID